MKRQAMKQRLPNIAFELLSGCNLDCVYCYNIWKIPGIDIRPGRGSYKKSIRTLKELFRQADVSNVTLTGGEPFLAERFMEVALFCRMAGKRITLITNGTKGARKDYEELVKVGVSLFELPVHSFDATVHDKMAGVPGSWAESVESIKTLRELGVQPVAVIVLTRHNVAGVAETLDFIAGLGIDRVMVNRYNIGGRGVAEPLSVSATHQELREAFAQIERKVAESLKGAKNATGAGAALKITSNVCTPHCVLDPADYPHIGFGNCSPDPLRRPITLDMDGNIRLCNHSPVVAGNIFETPLGEILYSPYSRSWGETVPEICAACGAWEQCLGGCRAASEQCGQGLSAADPLIAL